MCNPWPACGLVKGFLRPSKDVFIVYVQYTVANRRGQIFAWPAFALTTVKLVEKSIAAGVPWYLTQHRNII